jgi:hypothetical protein
VNTAPDTCVDAPVIPDIDRYTIVHADDPAGSALTSKPGCSELDTTVPRALQSTGAIAGIDRE